MTYVSTCSKPFESGEYLQGGCIISHDRVCSLHKTCQRLGLENVKSHLILLLCVTLVQFYSYLYNELQALEQMLNKKKLNLNNMLYHS